MPEWTPASNSASLALPIVLLLLTRGPWSAGIPARRMTVARWVLGAATSATFLAHGVKAWHHSPAFVDYLIVAAKRIGLDIQQATAEAVLCVIGVVDIGLAILMVVTRWRAVAFYMAAWALIGACARMVHSGWAVHFEVLIRAGYYCAPLIVRLSWQLTRPPRFRLSEKEQVDDSS